MIILAVDHQVYDLPGTGGEFRYLVDNQPRKTIGTRMARFFWEYDCRMVLVQIGPSIGRFPEGLAFHEFNIVQAGNTWRKLVNPLINNAEAHVFPDVLDLLDQSSYLVCTGKVEHHNKSYYHLL